jgi:hypothetical protein
MADRKCDRATSAEAHRRKPSKTEVFSDQQADAHAETLWKIGAQVKLSSVYHEKRLDPVFTVPNKENVSDRIALASLTSRAQKRAWYIAENAARGVFPSYASTTTAVEFDFVSLKTLMLERDEWRISAECHAHGIKRETYSGRTLNSVFKFSSSKAVRVKK